MLHSAHKQSEYECIYCSIIDIYLGIANKQCPTVILGCLHGTTTIDAIEKERDVNCCLYRC